MTIQQQGILSQALSESGIVPFHRDDEKLIGELCEIIGEFYRFAESAAKAKLPTDNVACIDLQAAANTLLLKV
jgi:hypothetical protein